MASDPPAVQDRVDHDNPCFGCGPANPEGLQLKSHPAPDGEGLVADWTPGPHHEGYPGVVAGGIQATLLDCHAVWTAAWHRARSRPDAPFPAVVTVDVDLGYHRPAPSDGHLHLRGHVREEDGRRLHVEVRLEDPEGTACTTGTVTVHRLDDPWGPNPLADEA